MSFASTTFILFFLIVYVAHWSLRGTARKALLLVASWVFYALWDWRFVGLLLLSTSLDYAVGATIAVASSRRAKRNLLLLSLGVNLGVLAFFKYAGFFVESMTALLSNLGVHVPQASLRIALPVGVSFYTFRSLSYTLDIYRGQLKPARSWLDYALFVAFFPLLGAGPIVRARRFLPQLATDRPFTALDLDAGFSRFVQGLVLKVFIADTLGVHIVDPVFARPEAYSAAILWLAMAAYAVQIYADFAGYSSMAIGVSRAFGFKVAENFAFPYLAAHPGDFWRRWHISLTSWFRDYLWWSLAKAIPFGGSIGNRLRWSGALMTVFLASGLWHGAGWTFLAWGGVHGLCVAISQQWRASRETSDRAELRSPLITEVPAWAATQLLVCLAWVLFRSRDFTSAWTFLRGLVTSHGLTPLATPLLVWVAFAGFLFEHVAGYAVAHRPGLLGRHAGPIRGIFYAGAIVLLWYGRSSHANEFVYFRF